MITGLAHVCFRVRDLDASLAFWRDRVGLPVAFEFRDDAGQRYGAYLRAGRRTFLEFFRRDDARAPAENDVFGHICLEVDAIDETVRALRARGVDVGDPTLGSDQSWQAWFSDPDGHRVELHQYTPASWQTPHLAEPTNNPQ